MESIVLNAKLRDKATSKPPALRREGINPAVVYGKGIESRTISVDTREFEKVYKQAGASTLVDLVVDGKEPVKVLIQEVAPHHITLKPIHVDFYQVSLTEKITATVHIRFIGEAPAVKNLSGILLKNTQEVDVECLATDLISEIEVDLSVLDTFDKAIKVKDLKVPATVTILSNPEDNVVVVQPPRVEEEAIPGVTEAEQIEDIKKAGPEKKKEGDEENKEEPKEGEK